MTHRFPLKEIARQAGLGVATIDRALNNRAHVSPQTKARVAAAISELENQEAQLAARGRRMFFDFVVEAPVRFSSEVKTAAEAVLPAISAAVCRPRFFMQEIMSEEDLVKILSRIAQRGSHGVCLKARNLPAICKAVDHLTASGIPVVTLVTDMSETNRIAYAGLDNESAGRTAAYLVSQAFGNKAGTVLAIRSNDCFLGEKERGVAFTDMMQQRCPRLRIVHASGGSGVHFETARVMEQITENLKDLIAVYSMGGGNRTILDSLYHKGLQPDIYIAHDLDKENRTLIEEGRLNFVLHHDLRTDMQNVFQAFLRHHRLANNNPVMTHSNIQIITPENIPPE